MRPRGDQRGAVMIWFALFLLLMLGFMALGTDIAKLMVTRTMLQNAADAAALAGASAIDFRTGVIDPDVAPAEGSGHGTAQQGLRHGPRPGGRGRRGRRVPGAEPGQGHDPAHRRRLDDRALHEGGRPLVDRHDRDRDRQGRDHDHGAVRRRPARGEPAGLGRRLPHRPDVRVLKDAGGSGTNGNYGGVDFPLCDQGECPGGPTSGASKWNCLLEKGYCCELTIGQVVNTEPGVKGAVQESNRRSFLRRHRPSHRHQLQPVLGQRQARRLRSGHVVARRHRSHQRHHPRLRRLLPA